MAVTLGQSRQRTVYLQFNTICLYQSHFPTIREIGVSYSRLLLRDSLLRDDSHRPGTSTTPYCEVCIVYETSEHKLQSVMCMITQEVI